MVSRDEDAVEDLLNSVHYSDRLFDDKQLNDISGISRRSFEFAKTLFEMINDLFKDSGFPPLDMVETFPTSGMGISLRIVPLLVEVLKVHRKALEDLAENVEIGTADDLKKSLARAKQVIATNPPKGPDG